MWKDLIAERVLVGSKCCHKRVLSCTIVIWLFKLVPVWLVDVERQERYRSSSQSVSQGFYSRWGQLAHLTKLQSFISKRNRQNGNIDKQNHHQKTAAAAAAAVMSTSSSRLRSSGNDKWRK